eukprot:TCALIF_12043-PA protein Name:"Protein of unknown function" AED:0.97 eAED:1.00 QI:0/-1/0/1/-1/1/1/0/181
MIADRVQNPEISAEVQPTSSSQDKLRLKCRVSDSRASTNTSNLDSRSSNQTRECPSSSSNLRSCYPSWQASVSESEPRISSAISDLASTLTISSQSDPKMSKQVFGKGGPPISFNQGNASGVTSNIKSWFFQSQSSDSGRSGGGLQNQSAFSGSSSTSSAFGRKPNASDLRGMNTWMPTSM